MITRIAAKLRGLASRWVDRWLPPGMNDVNRDEDRRARLLVRINLVVMLLCPSYALLYLWRESLIIGMIPLFVMALCLGSLVLLRDHGRVAIAGNMLLAGGFIGVVFMSFVLGLEHVPLLAWVPVIPMLALSLGGRRSGVVWAGICLLHFGAVHLCVAYDYAPPLADGIRKLAAARLPLLGGRTVDRAGSPADS